VSDNLQDRTFIEQLLAEEASVLGFGPYVLRWRREASGSEELMIRSGYGDIVVPFHALETDGIADKPAVCDAIRSRIAIELIGLRQLPDFRSP
jgi:hypothetical protein